MPTPDSFEARYRGQCGDCLEPIHPGQSVHYEHKGPLVHDVCPEDANDETPVGRNERMCPDCFTIHAGDCL